MPGPEDLQALMQGGGGPQPGPAAGPMAQPQQPEGDQAQGAAIVETAITLLLSALPALGPMSDKSGVVYDCVRKLQKSFGEGSGKELAPAQLQMLMQGQGGGANPEMMQAMQQASAQKPPGGMPGMM